MSNEEPKYFDSSELESEKTRGISKSIKVSIRVKDSLVYPILLSFLGFLTIFISRKDLSNFNYKELIKDLVLLSNGASVALLVGEKVKRKQQNNVIKNQDQVIRKTPGICGGYAHIRDTRIPVWTLVSLYHQGATEEELLKNYPGLTLDDLIYAWGYYYNHQSEINHIIKLMDE